jgi:N6-adenosine-specific RNA methylase IME4
VESTFGGFIEGGEMNDRASLVALRPPPGSSAKVWASHISTCWRATFEGILETGRLLIAAKEALPHGEFGPMVTNDLHFDKRMVERLMTIARDQRISNASNSPFLPPVWTTLYDLTSLDDDRFEAGIKNGTIRPDMTAKDIAPYLGKKNADTRRKLAQGLSDAAALQPTGRKFPVLYADPAWRRKAGIGNRAYENHFPTMSWEDILAMPVAERLSPDGWGFVWIPRAHLLALVEIELETPLGSCRMSVPLAWAIQIKWGFSAYSTCCVWTKTDEEVPDDQGTGLVFFDQDELLLVFKRGRGLPKPDTDVKVGSNHRERAGKHSAKPTYYRDMINAMTGTLPVLELFAREDENNWLPPNFYTWGNQSLNTAERIADDSRTNHQPESVPDSVGTDARQSSRASVSEPASAEPTTPHMPADAGSPSSLPEIILPGMAPTFEYVAAFTDLTPAGTARAS